MILTKFRFNWPIGLRGKYLLEINQAEKIIACSGHVCKRIGTKCAIFIEDPPRMFPTKVQFILVKGFQRRILKCERLTPTDDRRRLTDAK